jgi:hypothetical protein
VRSEGFFQIKQMGFTHAIGTAETGDRGARIWAVQKNVSPCVFEPFFGFVEPEFSYRDKFPQIVHVPVGFFRDLQVVVHPGPDSTRPEGASHIKILSFLKKKSSQFSNGYFLIFRKFTY